MSSFREGDSVVLVRDYNNNWNGKRVPQGTRGQVVKAPFGRGPTVAFSWRSAWSGERTETIYDLQDSDLRRV